MMEATKIGLMRYEILGTIIMKLLIQRGHGFQGVEKEFSDSELL
jgi:hypothetical protein